MIKLIKRISFFYVFAMSFLTVKAQPFVDVLQFNSQHVVSNYADSSKNPLYIQDNFLNVFIPKKFKNGNVLLLRLNTEQLTINRYGTTYSQYQLYTLAMPIGMQFLSKNEKWKYIGIIIPKLNSDFKDNLNRDFQLGAIGLVGKVFNPNLELKAGLYYNREFFGNFFLPLLGVDWKINNRFRMYGTLPSNFRAEMKLTQKWNMGFGFRAFTRSFRLSQNDNHNYIRINENQLKLYAEGFVVKNIALTLDVYQSVSYKLTQKDDLFPNQDVPSNLFAPFKNNIGFTVGLAYRIMK